MPDSPSRPGSSDELIAVGRVLGPHGRHGAVKIKAISDVAGRFDPGNRLSLSKDGATPQGPAYEITESQHASNEEVILYFDDIRRRDMAQGLTGLWLCVPVSEVPDAGEGEYFHYQLIGLKVRTTDGEELGELTEILETGSNDVYVVAGQDGDLLVPALSKVVMEVDVENGHMVVDLPEGLR